MFISAPYKALATAAAGVLLAASAFALPVQAASTLTAGQVNSIVTLLQAFGVDSGTIANVQAILSGNASASGSMSYTAATTGTSGTTSGVWTACGLSTSLKIGASGPNVGVLQRCLISSGYSIPAGVTDYFGTQTNAAISAWNAAHGGTSMTVTPTNGTTNGTPTTALDGQLQSVDSQLSGLGNDLSQADSASGQDDSGLNN